MRLLRFVLVLCLPFACSESDPEPPDLAPLELPSRAEVSTSLQGLDFPTFVERSFEQLLRRSPESLTDLGLARSMGLDNQHLDDRSLAFRRQTAEIEGDILAQLATYPEATLTEDQRLIAATYRWWLEDQRELARYAEHEYLLQPSFRGVHRNLELLMTQVHPFRDRQDAEDYVIRLWRVARVIDQAIDRIDTAAGAGIIPTRLVVDATRGQLDAFAAQSATATPYYLTFTSKGEEAGVIDDDLRAQARAAIAQSVQPAYRRLASLAGRLSSRAPSAIGVGQHPDGAAYYAATLRHHTTTNLSATEIADLGRTEIQKINRRMNVIFEDLGYSPGASLASNYARAASEGSIISASSVQRTYEELIEEATERSLALFKRLPIAPVSVVLVDSGGYYIGPSLDGTRGGAFYASRGSQPLLTMPTLAYHEAIPGHHLQIALASELNDLPLFQRVAGFTGYIEGWGLYAETLGQDLGWFDSPYTELGYLQFQAFRAARLVVDTGIHTGALTFDNAVQYFINQVGFSRGAAEGQVFRYVSWPGQATAYMVGQLELLALREEERARQGDAFDIREFHDVVLNRGALPLEILRGRFGP